MPAATAFLTRKRLAWQVLLDMPVGLTPPQLAETGLTCGIVLGKPGLRYHGPYTADLRPGRLVLLGIRNPGLIPVRSTDFITPLTFTFPGQQILSAQISPGPAARSALPPAIRLPAANTLEPGPGDLDSARIQLTGDFLLRPKDGYAVTLLLSGTPAAHSRPIQQEGALADGKIITDPGL
jgi:hypothetical protein